MSFVQTVAFQKQLRAVQKAIDSYCATIRENDDAASATTGGEASPVCVRLLSDGARAKYRSMERLLASGPDGERQVRREVERLMKENHLLEHSRAILERRAPRPASTTEEVGRSPPRGRTSPPRGAAANTAMVPSSVPRLSSDGAAAAVLESAHAAAVLERLYAAHSILSTSNTSDTAEDRAPGLPTPRLLSIPRDDTYVVSRGAQTVAEADCPLDRPGPPIAGTDVVRSVGPSAGPWAPHWCGTKPSPSASDEFIAAAALRNAVEGARAWTAMLEAMTAPLSQNVLRCVEPPDLRRIILEELGDASVPIRMLTPITHIFSGVYTRGIFVLRDTDLFIFRETKDENKRVRLPLRAMRRISLGNATVAEKQLTPSLVAAPPPASVQFFLMTKVALADTGRQYYRTVTLECIEPAETLIITFDTSSDVAKFSSLCHFLTSHNRMTLFSPDSGARGVPTPPEVLHGDLYPDEAQIVHPTVFSAPTAQLAHPKPAAVDGLDMMPTHEALDAVDTAFCEEHHIAPCVLASLRAQLLGAPRCPVVSPIDIAAMAPPVTGLFPNARTVNTIIDHLCMRRHLEPMEVVEVLPLS